MPKSNEKVSIRRAKWCKYMLKLSFQLVQVGGGAPRRDVAKVGGEGVRPPPLGFSGLRGPKARESLNSGGSNRNHHRSHEICAETDKKARQGSRGPSDHLGLPEKQGPCDYQGPRTAKVIISDPSDYQGPSQLSGTLCISGSL